MIIAFLFILGLLQIADLVTTFIFLQRNDGIGETNPLMKWLIDKTGFMGPVIGKVLVTGSVAAYTLLLPVTGLTYGLLIITIFLMIWVVINNLMALDVL